MLNMNLLDPWVAPVVCGVFTHAVSHHFTPESIPAYGSLLFMPPMMLSILSSPFSIFSTLRIITLYWISLSVSVALYRISPFHPLAQYKGPILGKVSRLWTTHLAVKGNIHEVFERLFEEYNSDVVRIGPNHLIIRDASALPVVQGPRNRWHKAPRYNITTPPGVSGSLLMLSEPAEHSKRRRTWERAFTPSAIRSYNSLLHTRVHELVANLASLSSSAEDVKKIDLTQWLTYMSMDFMGDFAYGGAFSFGTTHSDPEGFNDILHKTLRTVEIVATIPWIRPILVAMPPKATMKFRTVAAGVAERRKEKGSEYRDLFHHLLNEDGEGSDEIADLNQLTLAMEATLAIIAGSHTTSTALAIAITYLVLYPECVARLREELDAAAANTNPEDSSVLEDSNEKFSYDTEIPSERLVELKYLQAVINESMRLQPAIPHGVERTPPMDGGPVVVAGNVVPVGTVVQIPVHSLHSDTRYFSPDPESFWPERWLDEGSQLAKERGQDFKLVQGAFIPFSYGPTNCVGRALALHELRTVLALLMRRFDFEFAPGFDARGWLGANILARGPLEMVVRERKRA